MQFAVDFEAHAASMGAIAETVDNPAELGDAFKRAKAADRTTVICMKVDAYEGWTTEGHTWWEVGTPHVTEHEKVAAAHKDIEASRIKQRKVFFMPWRVFGQYRGRNNAPWRAGGFGDVRFRRRDRTLRDEPTGPLQCCPQTRAPSGRRGAQFLGRC
ncbi:hypothetical protein GQR58_000452 [Nymphon striatum]|nr:hypothetical protein GQR58_000452 [Nymphon striatum]